nr:hypothetical protein Itr_chr07CG17310 [Ipomoea trifida]
MKKCKINTKLVLCSVVFLYSSNFKTYKGKMVDITNSPSNIEILTLLLNLINILTVLLIKYKIDNQKIQIGNF